jgi:threonine dehydrogenase-like Zn-dependent dehydrogenase
MDTPGAAAALERADGGRRRPRARSVIIAAPGSARMAERAIPEPGPDQVRIRLEGCGVCGSNLPVWEGRQWFTYPLAAGAPGHEGWGVVDAIGPGVRGVRVGDRVAALSYHAFAEYDVADASAVVPLPASLGGVPFPGEPLGCALNVFRRSDIRAGQTVAIIGIGFLGALLTQLAVHAGARVIALSRREFALGVARDCGADEALALEGGESALERVRTLTDGALCDVTIEVTGLQAPLDLAGELTRERGRLVVAGFHQDGPRTVNMFLWNWRGLDVINAHERDPAVYVEGMRTAVAAVASGVLDPERLYTHRFALADAGSALEMLRNRPPGFMKALIVP